MGMSKPSQNEQQRLLNPRTGERDGGKRRGKVVVPVVGCCRVLPGMKASSWRRGVGGWGVPSWAVALPGQRDAKEGERPVGAGGRLEQRVGAALAVAAVERGDDAAHEGQLRPAAAGVAAKSPSSWGADGWRRGLRSEGEEDVQGGG